VEPSRIHAPSRRLDPPAVALPAHLRDRHAAAHNTPQRAGERVGQGLHPFPEADHRGGRVGDGTRGRRLARAPEHAAPGALPSHRPGRCEHSVEGVGVSPEDAPDAGSQHVLPPRTEAPPHPVTERGHLGPARRRATRLRPKRRRATPAAPRRERHPKRPVRQALQGGPVPQKPRVGGRRSRHDLIGEAEATHQTPEPTRQPQRLGTQFDDRALDPTGAHRPSDARRRLEQRDVAPHRRERPGAHQPRDAAADDDVHRAQPRKRRR